MNNIHLSTPIIHFCRRICDYEGRTGVNLFDLCFKQITKAQITEYRISGHTVRMDSKLISSNIAWFSRYEIIHATLLKEITKDGILQIEDQLIRQQTLEFFGEDAAKTVYQTDSESMNKCLTTLGIIINYILEHTHDNDKPLLKDALSNTEAVIGNKVKAVHADGAYQSPDNRKLAADE